MSDDITARLRRRRVFFSTDGGVHWYLGMESDGDCLEAAEEIERLREDERRLTWLLASDADNPFGATRDGIDEAMRSEHYEEMRDGLQD